MSVTIRDHGRLCLIQSGHYGVLPVQLLEFQQSRFCLNFRYLPSFEVLNIKVLLLPESDAVTVSSGGHCKLS